MCNRKLLLNSYFDYNLLFIKFFQWIYNSLNYSFWESLKTKVYMNFTMKLYKYIGVRQVPIEKEFPTDYCVAYFVTAVNKTTGVSKFLLSSLHYVNKRKFQQRSKYKRQTDGHPYVNGLNIGHSRKRGNGGAFLCCHGEDGKNAK